LAEITAGVFIEVNLSRRVYLATTNPRNASPVSMTSPFLPPWKKVKDFSSFVLDRPILQILRLAHPLRLAVELVLATTREEAPEAA
jgi:hypothetical protein